MDEQLSPALLEHVTYLGTKLPSFRDAHEALDVLLRSEIGLKRVERVTERIGGERVAERDADVAAWLQRPLIEKLAAPAGVKPPLVAAVLADGGRLQLRDASPGATSHWHEYKAGVLHGLASDVSDQDPCPQVPEVFLQRERIDKLTREITKVAASEASSPPTATMVDDHPASPPEDLDFGYPPPQVIDRDVVATRRDSQAFGRQLAARAWELGFFGAARKAWIGDGQNWLWAEWDRHFRAYDFVPILDFIHALTHVYAAAMAGRTIAEGWTIYVRWITGIWQGHVATIISELAARQAELGLPEPDDAETHPRTLISKTLTYLQNQQSRMKYPEYRKQGLPITSAHMESTVKLLNRRIKGSEKYWSESGAEALLQLTADSLCTSQPLAEFWRKRPHRQTGYRTYTKRAT